MLRGMAERVASDDLFDEIDIPVAVIAGRSDAFVGLEELQKISDGIRGATLHVLECGHVPQWEAPEALDRILESLQAAAAR
jgi:pimeloyl-ACP methyl ester carboxylesterase